MSTTASLTSLDGFHSPSAAQRADELVRAFLDAVSDDPARTDVALARSFLSCDAHGTRSRTGLKRSSSRCSPTARSPTAAAWPWSSPAWWPASSAGWSFLAERLEQLRKGGR